ncbi:MAG: choice-of-anchor Q domain-containing protein, partial [Thermomicrobiales bacterium]
EPPPTGARVYNNSVYRSDSGGVRLLDASRSDKLIYNNISYSPAGGAIIGGTAGSYGANMTQNPLWVNPGAGDFHLQSGSPAIDAGVTGPVFDDWDGTTRPVNGDGANGAEYDIGPYEYTP